MSILPETEVDRDAIAALRADPPRLGELAALRRAQLFGARVEVRPCPALTVEGLAKAYKSTVDGALESLEAWPHPESLQPGESYALTLEPTDEGAAAWLDWLDALAGLTPKGPAPLRIAPFTSVAAGTFRLWAIASARLRLGDAVRVEARHDLIGIRLAQVALAFGADTLAGPVDEDRHLPLAGVTRPNETTRTGLCALVEQCGLEAHWAGDPLHDSPPPARSSTHEH